MILIVVDVEARYSEPITHLNLDDDNDAGTSGVGLSLCVEERRRDTVVSFHLCSKRSHMARASSQHILITQLNIDWSRKQFQLRKITIAARDSQLEFDFSGPLATSFAFALPSAAPEYPLLLLSSLPPSSIDLDFELWLSRIDHGAIVVGGYQVFGIGVWLIIEIPRIEHCYSKLCYIHPLALGMKFKISKSMARKIRTSKRDKGMVGSVVSSTVSCSSSNP